MDSDTSGYEFGPVPLGMELREVKRLVLAHTATWWLN